MNYFEEFKNIIASKTGDATKITMDSNLKELGLDSLDLVEILMSLEEEFSVSIPDEAIPNIKTVGDLVAFIDKAKK